MKTVRAVGMLLATAIALAACSSAGGAGEVSGGVSPTVQASSSAAMPSAESSFPSSSVLPAPTATGNASAAPPADGRGDCPGAEAFCIGLVTDTAGVLDKSANQLTWTGILEGAKAVGGYAKYTESVAPLDFAANIDAYASKGYDVIVTVGFSMVDATRTAAQTHPGTHFIGVDQFQTPPLNNLTGLLFPEDRAGFIAGYLASLMTKTNKVGAVLPSGTIAPIKLYGEGFRAGALAAKPTVIVTLSYHPSPDSFADTEWGMLEAQKLLAQGHDIIFAAGGLTAEAALAEVAKSPGAGQNVFCIGAGTDRYLVTEEAAKCLLTTAEKKIALSTKDLVMLVHSGTPVSGYYRGAVGLAPYHDTESVVPADVQKRMAEVIAGVESNTIRTNVAPN